MDSLYQNAISYEQRLEVTSKPTAPPASSTKALAAAEDETPAGLAKQIKALTAMLTKKGGRPHTKNTQRGGKVKAHKPLLQDKKLVTCSFCNKSGHTEAKCFKKKRQSESEDAVQLRRPKQSQSSKRNWLLLSTWHSWQRILHTLLHHQLRL